MTLLDILKDIRDNGPYTITQGICSNVLEHPQHVCGYSSQLKKFMRRWPERSSDEGVADGYVIPGVNGLDAITSYQKYTWIGDGWNPENPYGAKRLELLDWLIAELEAEQ